MFYFFAVWVVKNTELSGYSSDSKSTHSQVLVVKKQNPAWVSVVASGVIVF